MKKTIFIFVFFIFYICTFAQNNFICMSEVIPCENLSSATIYSNIMQNWTILNGANEKIENQLDYCDKEQGIINIKTKLYLGFRRFNLFYGFDGYANAHVMFKIKDNRYKVTLTIKTITFDWTCKQAPQTHTVDINELYPVFNYRVKYLKKTSDYLVLEQMPSIVNNFFILCKTLHKASDDF